MRKFLKKIATTALGLAYCLIIVGCFSFIFYLISLLTIVPKQL